ADVAGDRAHRDQAARVVGSGGVLRDAHAPVDDAGAGLSPQPGNLPDDLGVDTGDLGDLIGWVGLDGLGQRVVVGGAVRDEVPVHETQPNHFMHDGVVEGHVGAGLEL